MKKVSIVLAPFNNNETFKKVFLQILQKTNFDFKEIEIIVIDNNTDKTKIADVYSFVVPYMKDYTIKYYSNKNIHQLAGATNKAIELADSKWFVYLCASDTYIYHNDWLNHILENLSDVDYQQGYRQGGTIAPWPNFLPNPKDHVHVQGGIVTAYTEYMKKNKYLLTHPFSFCDVIHSAQCIKQGFKLKTIPRVFSSMGTVTDKFHQENLITNKYYITHLHGNGNIK